MGTGTFDLSGLNNNAGPMARTHFHPRSAFGPVGFEKWWPDGATKLFGRILCYPKEMARFW